MDPAVTTMTPAAFTAATAVGASGANTSGLDVDSLVFLASMERHNILEKNVRSQVETIDEKNKKCARLRDALNFLNQNRPDSTGCTGVYAFVSNNQLRELLKQYPDLKPNNMVVWRIRIGAIKCDFTMAYCLNFKGGDAHAALMGNVASSINAQTTDSQTEMLKLQANISKADEVMEFASNCVRKSGDMHKKFVQNM